GQIECADEGRGGKEISSEFVVAGGDAPPILDTTEEVFDFVPLPIETLRTIGLFDRVATFRDDRQSSFVLDLLTRCLTVIGLVGGHDERRSRRIQDVFDDLTVVACPPVTVKFSGRPLPSTTAWIFVVRPPRLMPIA